jgi:hypothetical protein
MKLYELFPLKVSINNQVIGSLERFNFMLNLCRQFEIMSFIKPK